MEQSLSAKDAHSIYTIMRYTSEAQKTCYNKCVVDFQTDNISAMEKECAKACITKHMAILNDLRVQQTL